MQLQQVTSTNASGLNLKAHNELMVAQKKELAELMGYESRNKYEIKSGSSLVAYAAEQGKGFGAALMRQMAGHFRTFEIHIFDSARKLQLKAVHPFRFFFQRLEVSDAAGNPIGAVQQKFAIFHKRFEVTLASGETLAVKSPLWKPWTFEFKKDGRTEALVQKKFSGALKEMFTDADNFQVAFPDASLSESMRAMILASAIFIDLQYFEKKAD